MKIAFDVAQTCRPRAGCAWHADALARAMAKQVAPEDFQLLHHFGRWVNPSPEKGTRIDGIAAPLQELDMEGARAFWAAVESGETELPGAPDIAQSTSFMAPLTGRAKLVYTVHDVCFWSHPEFGTSMNRLICQEQILLALQRASAFHFISDTARADFEQQLPGWLEESGRPWLVARSGLRLRPDANAAAPRTRFADPASAWLFVGTIEPRKNLTALLTAYELYWERSPIKRPLTLVGATGWHSEPIRQRIETMSQRLPVRYLGSVEDAQLIQAYANAFAFLQPSHHEGFGLTTLEALAFGLPCLANPHPAADEFRSDALRFVAFSDPEAVSEAMLHLERSPETYLQLSQSAVGTAAPYNWERTAETLLDFYESLL